MKSADSAVFAWLISPDPTLLSSSLTALKTFAIAAADPPNVGRCEGLGRGYPTTKNMRTVRRTINNGTVLHVYTSRRPISANPNGEQALA